MYNCTYYWRRGGGHIEVRTVDYHTAGEPFRIVTGGAPQTPGPDVRARREHARSSPEHEAIRTLLCQEPRGHADMYGCLLVPPDDAGAHLGALFWHKDGWSTACGHGSIALGRWALDTALLPADDSGTTEVRIDVPSGRVRVGVTTRDGRVEAVAFHQIASYVLGRDVPVRTSHGEVRVDLAYGGAIYASLPASRVGLEVGPADYTHLIAAGREIKHGLTGTGWDVHPSDGRLSGIYGTILYEELTDTRSGPHQRNVTVFADGQVDRSPCGSGTAARVALLHDEGRLRTGDTLTHESVIGTRFRATVDAVTRADDRPAVLPVVEGQAYRTGEHRFVLDPYDDLGHGFVLR